MICPQCGLENFQGVDECENCGADLRAVDLPEPGIGFEARLVDVPLAAVRHNAPLTIHPAAPAADAISRLREAAVGCLIVEDEHNLIGILSERDLVLKLSAASVGSATVAQLMTPDPVVLRPDDSVAVAINKMAVGGFRHIPLVEDGRATGIVSARDLFRYILATLG
jgi:CBS domain-containing protein